MIIGQAPGPREPTLKRPFAHTAGQTLFRWFKTLCGMDEAVIRSKLYFAAVCRCSPGKAPGGTDRVPAPGERRSVRVMIRLAHPFVAGRRYAATVRVIARDRVIECLPIEVEVTPPGGMRA